jgi:hypothetical protein
VHGKSSLVWFLPYLAPDAVPIAVDAQTGDRVRIVGGQWRRCPWSSQSGE